MINKLDINAKNLTLKAGIFLLLEETKNNDILDNESTNKSKMNT